LLSLDGVAPSRMVNVSASVNLPLHHKVHKFSSGTGSSGWYRKKNWKRDRKTVVVWWLRTYFWGVSTSWAMSPESKPLGFAEQIFYKTR